MKSSFALLITIFLINILHVKALEPEKWVNFESHAFSYNISFPLKPEDLTETLDTEAGELRLNVVELDCSKADGYNNLVYMVNCTVYPDSLINSKFTDLLDNFFKGTIKGAVTNVAGVVISESNIEYAGFPGREVRISADEGNSFFISRLYLINSHFFMLIILTDSDNKDNPDINKFFNSFRYTGSLAR